MSPPQLSYLLFRLRKRGPKEEIPKEREEPLSGCYPLPSPYSERGSELGWRSFSAPEITTNFFIPPELERTLSQYPPQREENKEEDYTLGIRKDERGKDEGKYTQPVSFVPKEDEGLLYVKVKFLSEQAYKQKFQELHKKFMPLPPKNVGKCEKETKEQPLVEEKLEKNESTCQGIQKCVQELHEYNQKIQIYRNEIEALKKELEKLKKENEVKKMWLSTKLGFQKEHRENCEEKKDDE